MTAWKFRRHGTTFPKIANREGIAPVLTLELDTTTDFA